MLDKIAQLRPVLSFVILGLRSSRFPLAKTSLMTVLAVVMTACGKSDDSQITVYRIPKEQPPAQPVENNGAQGNHALSVQWKAPSDWEELPVSGFRKGSYRVRGADGKTADISVISFPESAGGLLANVNRWRNQLNRISQRSSYGLIALSGMKAFFFQFGGQ